MSEICSCASLKGDSETAQRKYTATEGKAGSELAQIQAVLWAAGPGFRGLYTERSRVSGALHIRTEGQAPVAAQGRAQQPRPTSCSAVGRRPGEELCR